MLNLAKRMLKGASVDTGSLYQTLSRHSLLAAIREQGLGETCDALRAALPDLRDQYTLGFDEREYERYWEIKLRGMHAWQITCILDALNAIPRENLVLADIGDSSGNHSAYVSAMAPAGKVERMVSVNLDATAVEKIRKKGFEAIQCRAEEIDLEQIRPDLFLSFEMVEHLTDPVRFLHGLAVQGSANNMLITVPYRRDSRFGGHHMRLPEDRMPKSMTAEEVHVWELSPADWELLARFAGWRTVWRRTYFQYPKRSILRATAPLWRELDLEGFLGLFLERDLELADRYADW